MAYQATVIPVMIASPSDVPNERRIVREVINGWNYVNSMSRRVVLMPTGWETHAAPEIGSATAQDLINTRVLEHCDLLVGVFWTRLGTPTGKAASGTAEEIERHIRAGKPALVYFSSAPVVPDSLDHEQYEALKTFKAWCQQQGLIQIFNDAEQFRRLFEAQLGITLNQSDYLKVSSQPVDSRDVAGSREHLVTISADAVELLLAAAADPHGTLMKLSYIGGRRITAGRRSFGEPKDHRSMARWEHAFNELVDHGLIQDRGYKGEVFELTENGYRAADQAKAAMDAASGDESDEPISE